MQILGQVLRKSAAKVKLHVTWVVWISLFVLSEHMEGASMDWHVKNGILFVKIDSHGKKMLIYRDKMIVLQKINRALQENWYKSIIKDIRFTQ